MTPTNWPPPLDHVPGDLFADLLRDWQGPLRWSLSPDTDVWTDGVLHGAILDRYRVFKFHHEHRLPADRLCLPLTRPEAAHRLARVLAAGAQCPTCGGTGEHPLRDAKGQTCDRCRGTGYLRPPAPAWHCLPVALGGSLHFTVAQHSATLLACSAWRAKAGLGPVRGPLGAWSLYDYGKAPRKVWQRAVPGVGDAVVSVWEDCAYHHGWTFDPSCSANRVHGDETGPTGRAHADAAALAAGFALLSADGSLTLPWPKERPC